MGLRDHDGLALEAPKPVTLPTVIPGDLMGRCFALQQLVLWDDRRRGSPLIHAGHLDGPLREALDPLLQRLLVSSPTFPVHQLPRVPSKRLPTPEFAAFVLQVVPQRITLPDDGASRGLWLLVGGCGQVPDPGEHSLG